MRGASALNRLLAEFPDAHVRVQVVWEPVLKSDIAAPFSRVLGLLHDRRVRQYWDPQRVISVDLVRSVNDDPARYRREDKLPPSFISWDVVAVFAKSAHWDRDLPVPVYYGGPVVESIEATRKAIADELTSAATGSRLAADRGHATDDSRVIGLRASLRPGGRRVPHLPLP